MRRIISATIFLLFGVPAAMVAQTFSYVINGKVGNWSSPAKAYLISSTATSVQIDSTPIKDGLFSFKAVAGNKSDEPFLVVARSGNRIAPTGVRSIRFYTDAPTIRVVISDSLTNVQVIGGKLNKDNAILQAALAPVEAKIKEADRLYQGAADYEERMSPLEKEQKAVYLKFIKSHPNSLISLKALTAMGGHSPDVAEVEAPFRSLSPTVRSTKLGMEYAAKLKEWKKVDIGKVGPDFTLRDTSGRFVSLHDFKGKYLLLDFWASWCPPCRAESPFITEAFAAYKERNFTVLGVTLDNPDKKDAWIKAINDDRLTWTQVASDKMYDNAAANLYSVTSIPRNFLIAPDGRIIAKNLRGKALMEKLRELLGESR